MPQQQNKTFTNWYNQKAIPFIQETKWIFFAFFLFGAFHTVIESFLNTILVNPILSKFEDNWIARIGLISLLIITTIKTVASINKKKYISNKHLICILLPTLVFTYYRFLSNAYNLISIGIWHIAYLDIIVLCIIFPPIISKIVKIFSIKKQKLIQNTEKLNYTYATDTAIKNSKDDKLNRSKIAQQIAEQINNTKTIQDSLSIAIEAPWGNGKTSFLYLIKEKLNSDIIVYDFNPWTYSNNVNLTTVFFNGLSKTLQPYDSSISNYLIEYANILSNIENKNISSTAKLCGILLSKKPEEQFQILNLKLKTLNKRIIIFIDDLDRLHKTEILSVLKIIRNNANFSNIYFISAYDQKYIIESLTIPRAKEYLEKIFQQTYLLPKPNMRVLEQYLIGKLSYLLSESDYQILLSEGLDHLHTYFYYKYLSNFRLVNQFINALSTSYALIKDDTYIFDLLNLTLLKVKYIESYKLLSHKIKEYSSIQVTTRRRELNKENQLRGDLSKIEESHKIPIIMSIINLLFIENRNKKSIRHIKNIDIYFNDQLNEGDISYTEFENLLSNDIKDIIIYIDNCDSLKKESLIEKFKNHKIINALELEKTIYSLFHICALTRQDKNMFFIPKLLEYQIINDKIYEFKNKKVAKLTINKIFRMSEFAQHITYFFQEMFSKNDNPNFIFTRQEALDISYSFFKTELEAENLHNIFFYFLEIKSFDYDNKQTPLIINDIKNLIISKPEKMLPTFINGIQDSKNVISYSLNTFIRTLWNNISDLEKSFTNNKSPLVREFLKFVELWENTEGYTKYEEKYIDLPDNFSFKYITVPHENISNF